MRSFKPAVGLGVAVAASVALAACGGSNSDNGGGGGSGNSQQLSKSGFANVSPVSGQQKGGTLKIVSPDAWEHLDPGISYYQVDYIPVYAVHRPLYAFTAESPTKAVPDLAAGPAKISKDGKTVTVKIRPNVKWSPPLNRNITSDDVRYAFERDFNPNVPNAYASSYYPIVGADKAKGGHISGIETPDKQTIIFHLTSGLGATFAQSLSLPGSAPVPREVAAKMDKSSPTKYDTNITQQAFSGPYMITQYKPGRSMTLERNPNWDSSTDYRPAYADRIEWKAGGDANVLARQTLNSTDQLMVTGPPAPVLKYAYQNKRDQLTTSPLGDYYTALNTTKPPFNDVNLRRAVIAASDRDAYLLARGGKLVGQVATHFLGPEIPGYQEAGGAKGFGVDYMSNTGGSMKVACKYMKAAGYPNCKYTGNAKVVIVGSDSDPGPKEMQIVQAGMQKLGFKTEIKAVPQETMYAKFCGYTKGNYNACPTAGWIEDWPDAYSYLYVPFSGKAIVPVNNSNWAQLDDPKINAAMDQAATITDPTARAKAWAKVDRMLVDAAPAIPEVFSTNANVEGSQVHGVLDKSQNSWSLSYSSVK